MVAYKSALDKAGDASALNSLNAYTELESFLAESRWDLTPKRNTKIEATKLAARFWDTASYESLVVFDEWTNVRSAILSTPRR